MIKHLLSILLLSVVPPLAASGQKLNSYSSPMGSLASAKNASFSSVELGFAIDLPESSHGFSGTNGSEYTWKLKEGFYLVGVVRRNANVEASADFDEISARMVDDVYGSFARNYFATKAEVIKVEKSALEFLGHKALQVRLQLSNSICLIRVFWVGNRGFKFGALLAGDQRKFETTAIGVFDSITLSSSETVDVIMRQRVKENTPAPLPQSPVVRKQRSDAEDAKMKGRVKELLVEEEYTLGPKTGSPKHVERQEFFNEAGNFTKIEEYNGGAYPRFITVFGYVAGFRVSKNGSIVAEGGPPGLVVEMPGGRRRKYDTRYDSRLTYRYDAAGELVEQSDADSSGSLTSRTVYRKKESLIEAVRFDERGQVNSRWTIRLDERGNEIEQNSPDSPLEGWAEILTYEYLEFDAQGNWTKRMATFSRSFSGVTKPQWAAIQYRTIKYY